LILKHGAAKVLDLLCGSGSNERTRSGFPPQGTSRAQHRLRHLRSWDNFRFCTKDYLEKSVSCKCAVCNVELEADLKEQLKAYRWFHDSMSRCERVEFRVRLGKPEAAAPRNDVQEAVSAAVAELQQAVTTALAKEHAAGAS
jgi:hypothetical protein